MTSAWPGGRALHGGADEIPLPEGRGRLWLCGKHFVGPDPRAALSAVGADRIVCLCERHELSDRYPAYLEWLLSDPAASWFPIPDLHAPSVQEAHRFLAELRRLLGAGNSVLMHCGAGIGRAGTMATALLLTMGAAPAAALATVAAHRPMAGPEAGAQRDLLEQLAASGTDAVTDGAVTGTVTDRAP